MWKIKGGRHEDEPVRETISEEPPPSYEEAVKAPVEQAIPNTTKLMISYQWESKTIVRKIRDILVDCGFQVWMDEIHMSMTVFITYFTILSFKSF